jgi:hypothetical protein
MGRDWISNQALAPSTADLAASRARFAGKDDTPLGYLSLVLRGRHLADGAKGSAPRRRAG